MSFSKNALFVAIALLTSVSCGGESYLDDENEVGVSEQEITASQWKAASQSTRNQMILDRAARDIGRYVGIQCKPWVSKVVSDASSGTATVSPTVTSPWNTKVDPYGWALSPSSAYTIGMSTDIRNVQPGWIVQMRLHNPVTHAFTYPHTAIVAGRTTTGVNFVDSNYVATNTVGTHFMTFADFEAKTYENGAYQYSVYYIGGG